jgi:hypothetical protein
LLSLLLVAGFHQRLYCFAPPNLPRPEQLPAQQL